MLAHYRPPVGSIPDSGTSNVRPPPTQMFASGLGPQRRDCLAGHVGLELRNVVANYPFESSRGFPGSKPNSGHRDHSRLRCSAGGTQLGPGAASRGRPRAHVGHIAELTRKLARDLCRSKDDPPAAKPGHHCAVRMRDLATDGDESAPNVHVVNESPT